MWLLFIIMPLLYCSLIQANSDSACSKCPNPCPDFATNQLCPVYSTGDDCARVQCPEDWYKVIGMDGKEFTASIPPTCENVDSMNNKIEIKGLFSKELQKAQWVFKGVPVQYISCVPPIFY